MTNSTVSGNTALGFGGGILNNQGTTTLTNSTVSGNMALDGGGIENLFAATLTLTNSTVSGNSARNGGGIDNREGTTTLTNSTVSGNTASFAGGIYNRQNSSTLTLTNSTVSGNMALDGGGIFNEGTLNITSVTVTRNNSTITDCTTFCAGGISNFNTANLKNTIIAGNTVADASSSPDFRGAVATGSSFNLIGNGQGTTGISNGDATSNQVGVDPKLDPTLQLNGGTTANHTLLFGSPAIDKGNSFGLTTDQRGLLRPVDFATYPNATGGNGADIGAVELQNAPTAASATIGGRVLTESGRGIRNVWITLTDSSGNVRTATTTFGYYRFADVAAGETYIITAFGKLHTFSQPSQVLNINGDLTDINFIGHSNFFSKQEK